MKISLPDVTLMCVDSVNPELSKRVLDICQRQINFGEVKLIDANLTSLVMYSVWCLKEMYKHIDTTHVLIVQCDGFIINPQMFKSEWLELDYIAPLFVQMDDVGSGGFSLRSKRLMQYASKILPEWNGTDVHANELQKGLGYYEDGVLCFDKRFKNFKFATKENACEFAQGGNRNPEYFREYPFGFHRTWQEIDFKTGKVDSTTVGNTLKNSYDKEINDLWFT